MHLISFPYSETFLPIHTTIEKKHPVKSESAKKSMDEVIESIMQRAKDAAGEYNRLRSWMIRQSLINAKGMIRRLTASNGAVPPLDDNAFYEAYCQYRNPPSFSVLRLAKVVGFAFVRDPEQQKPVYLIFFILGWGAWFISTTVDYEHTRYQVLDIVDKLVEHGATFVCYSSSDYKSLYDTTYRENDPSLDDYRFPTSVYCIRHNEESTLEEDAWRILKTDIISWNLAADLVRVSEEAPKHPIKFSFYPSWRPRTEQFKYLALRAFIPAMLYLSIKERDNVDT